MEPLKFAVLGCGFWARYQISAWKEIKGVKLVALYNRTLGKADALAKEFNVEKTYSDAEKMFQEEELDFVDIITDVAVHRPLVEMAAKFGIPVICQKPMAPTVEDARAMVDVCKKANVPYFVHENFRWQAPIRALKNALDSNKIGRPYRARISFRSSFPVFENQPFLATVDKFILADVGSHTLDIARFLFGEAKSLYCQTCRVNPYIKGEDVATTTMKMTGKPIPGFFSKPNEVQCTVEMSYAAPLEEERFPQTFVQVEGENGSLYLGPDFNLRHTTKDGTYSQFIAIPEFSWAHPRYAVAHVSGVPTNQDIVNGIRGIKPAETTGEDNLRTVELVFASYQSAQLNQLIHFSE